MKSAVILALAPLMSLAANYSAQKLQQDGIDIVRLTDDAHKVQVSIVPSIGNNAYEMKVNGRNVFWFPFAGPGEFKAKPTLAGNPLLAPWANRLDHDGFYANGKHYALDRDLQNYRVDSFKHPIHGVLAYSPHWKVVGTSADGQRAEVVSRLEFWRYPDYMAQFPFAHTIDMIYRLRDGVLEVETVIENHAIDPMPVSIGYHPYFKVHDAPRDQWKVTLPVREQVVLSKELIPTGETKPISYTSPVSLSGIALDDVFSGIIRDSNGRAEFSVQGERQKVFVIYGEKYPVAVVYAPSGRDFICFEPMSGPTNAMNLHQAGKYKELQSIAPGAKWRESFWIQATGF
jgi:aldose 1-epimerase